jgi:hypothetical protein
VTYVADASSSVGSTFPIRGERSFRTKHLATQLLLRLNPKRGAAALARARPLNGSCGPRLRLCEVGGNKLPKQERHYGFGRFSYKCQLELDLRYTQPHLPALRSQHD